MRFLFLMDPLHTVKMEKDTSFILMLGAHRRFHEVFFLPEGGITSLNGILYFRVLKVVPQQIKGNPFQEIENCIVSEDEIDAIFIRPDPPFDYEYLMNTWLLNELADKIPIINHPLGIRTANEKIWVTRYPDIIPPTLIGRNREDLKDFLIEHKDIIAKPTDGFGGQSIFRIKESDRNANVILETLTNKYQRDIILQQYIKDAREGDKRILLLDGEPLGAVLRVHSKDDHRNNFFSGGKPMETEITPHEHKIIEVIKPELKKLGLHFVGIDMLGEYLIEVNVTSPTCLQEISHFQKKKLEEKVISFAEKLVEQHKMQDKINS